MAQRRLVAGFVTASPTPDHFGLGRRSCTPRENRCGNSTPYQYAIGCRQLVGFFFNGLPNIKPEQFASKKLSDVQVRQSLQLALWRLEKLMVWNEDTVKTTLMSLSEQMEIKLRDFMPAFFIAIAGSTSSTPVMESMVTLGADLTYARLRHALEVLGGGQQKRKRQSGKSLMYSRVRLKFRQIIQNLPNK